MRVIQPMRSVDQQWNDQTTAFASARQSVTTVRNDLTRNYVKAKTGAGISEANTIVASGVLKWFGIGEERVKRYNAVPSGNPQHKSKTRIVPNLRHVNVIPVRYHEEHEIGGERINRGEHGNCAEQKILRLAKSDIGGLLHYKDETPHPSLTIISEKTPCSVCEEKIAEFMKLNPDVSIFISAKHIYTGLLKTTWKYQGQDGDYHLSLFPQVKPQISSGIALARPKPPSKNDQKPRKKTTTPANIFTLLDTDV